MNEFLLIKKHFAPLAKDFNGSLNLTDDTACIDVPVGKQLVITKDAISACVHFIGDESPDLIAQKLLRVNLSDLAAKGATPYCYFVAAHLPKETNEEWIKQFASGLAKDQETFGIHLAGGDTTHTTGPLCLSLTAIGLVDKGTMLKRSGAQYGDDVYVSGTLGRSFLGLRELQQAKSGQNIPHYLLPPPRLELGQKLVGLAHACMDISDGLMQDMQHICSASGVGAHIMQPSIPLPDSTTDWQDLISGGDDYELLFTAPSARKEAIQELAKGLDISIALIGKITEGNAATLLDANQNEIALPKQGYKHF